MNKRNVFLRTAVAGALLTLVAGAQAGSVSGSATYAVENFGTGSTATTAILAPAVTYTFATPGGIVVNPSGTVYAYVRLNAGTFASTTAVSAANFSLGGGISGLSVGTVVASADLTTLKVPLTNNGTTGTGNVVIGVGGTLILGAGTSVRGLNTTLNTVGGSATVSMSIGSTSASSIEAATATPADLDNGLSNAQKFAVAAQGASGTVTASSSFSTAETALVDLTATNPGSRFVTVVNGSTSLLNLGSVLFSDSTASTLPKTLDGTTAYTLAAQATTNGLTGTVTGVFKAGSVLTLSSAIGCGSTTATFGALNTAATGFSLSATLTSLVANTTQYVCYNVGTSSTSIPLTSPTASFSIAKTLGNESATTAAGSLYVINNNGKTVDVRTYVPSTAGGYTTFIRAINTGTVKADVTGQFIKEDGSLSGTAKLGTLNAGGSVTWTSAQIEAAFAAADKPASGDRPRLRLTAPTNGLNAQSFLLTNSNSDFSDVTGAQ